MTDDLSLEITHRTMWLFSKDLFGEPQQYFKRVIKYFCIFFIFLILIFTIEYLFLVSNISSAINTTNLLIFLLIYLLSLVWFIHKHNLRIEITDNYYVDENNNLVITRHYPKNKSLTKTILAKDIKGFKIHQIRKINPKSQLLAIDTTQGDFVLDFYSQDIPKLQEFLRKYYPQAGNNGDFKNIEKGIKRFNIFCVLSICIIIFGFIYSYIKYMV